MLSQRGLITFGDGGLEEVSTALATRLNTSIVMSLYYNSITRWKWVSGLRKNRINRGSSAINCLLSRSVKLITQSSQEL
jgi:hypothetical protein